MADTKISALPSGSPIAVGDEFVLARSGSNYKVAASDFAALSQWAPISVSLTYSSADGPTYVCTTGSDLTGVIPVGARIKLTHSATTKYFIVTAINSTTITLYGGTDYTLAATAITAVSYSVAKAPLGFPLSPAKWTVTTTDTSDRAQASPTSGTWYNLGSLSISIPIGCWRVFYQVTLDAAGTNSAIYVTLSSANNSESDNATTCLSFASTSRIQQTQTRETLIDLAAKASRFLNAKTSVSGLSSIDFRGDLQKTVIQAVCAYL